MSNYTPDFKGTNMDQRLEEQFPVELAQIENAQQAYREIIEAMVLILRKRGLTYYLRRPFNGIEGMDRLSFLDLASFLGCSVAGEIKTLENAGFDYSIEGDDCTKFFDQMYALLKSPFRPQTTRGMAPSNPATLESKKKAGEP